MMTTKSYKILASVIKKYKHSGFSSGVMIDRSLEALFKYLIPALKEDNPKFNETIFKESCDCRMR